MRFQISFTSYIVLGLISTTYALPSSVIRSPHARSDLRSVEGQPSDMSVSAEAGTLDTLVGINSRDNDPVPTTTISVTFPVSGSRKSFKVQSAAKKAVQTLLNKAKSKLDITGDIQVVFTNLFTSPKIIPTEILFTFSVKACEGRCKGLVKGPGEGVINDAKNKVIFQAD
ncbi:hypothetical protein C8J55DRAFT_246621 [Lentinula edodes]|uniref:Uncharacterized protein n=1 Tax=Lentinula lateritia TaxID=40482 RepID=A0A9W8ZSN7_9AGAR|nr:hypothetical protein C8J55DRAFT_246621 [Lentinula edodes]